MAVLETIRVKIGWLITALIAIALLSFIVDFNSLSSVMQTSSDKYTVGKINGQKVSYKDFQEQVEYQTSIAELLGSNATNTDEGQQQIRQAAWQHFVDEYLFIKTAKNAGISVGKDELVDLTTGTQVSPVMMYDPVFGDPNGNFDKQKVVEFVKNIDADASGNARNYWNYVQNNVLTQQYYTKYGSLFSASDVLNNLTLNNVKAANNITASARYVEVPFGFQTDTTIKVTSSEIKSYYNAHKDNFRQIANRDIEFAMFEVVPSEDDLDAASKSLEDVYEEFATTTNVKNFLMRNSDRQLSNYYYKAGELNTMNREINDFVFGDAKGVSPVIKSGNEYYAVKVVDTKAIPDSVYVRHILIQNDDKLADSLFNVVKANKNQFSQLAALYSADQNPNVPVPGDLGWMTQVYMIPGMEAVLTAKVNEPFELTTQYGRHIVEVIKATKPIQKKQVAILQKTAVPSKATMNDYYNKANTLATKAAGKIENLREAAKEQGVYLRPMNVTEATAQYNAVQRAKEVTRWIFDAKKGAASNVITVNQNYLFVVGVKEVHKEGYATVSEAAARINPILYQQKLADKVAAEVTEKIAGLTTIEEIATALDKTVTDVDNVSFESYNSYGREPALIGAIAGCEKGKITAPVKGNTAVYVVTVTERNEGAFYTDDDAKAYQAQKAQYSSQMVIPALLESTGSVDNRERFY